MGPMHSYEPRKDPETGENFLPVSERGQRLLHTPLLNKGTAFSEQERDLFGLHGLLPPRVSSMEDQLTEF